MKKFWVYVLLSFISIKVYSQDTISFMDGSIQVVPSFDKLIEQGITNKITQLIFTDFENNTINIDTNCSRPYVINSWATWCHPCIAEIPTFNKIKEKYKDCDVDFYALSYFDDSIGTTKFLESHPFYFKQIRASQEYIKKNKLANGLPTTLFVDKKGNVLFKINGGSNDPEKQEETLKKFTEGLQKIGCNYKSE